MKDKEKILSQYFLNICVQYGFCLSQTERNSLIENSGRSASDFVKRVIAAEGLREDEAEKHFESLYSCLLNGSPFDFFDCY